MNMMRKITKIAGKKYLFVEKVSEKFVVKPTWREYEKQDNELVIELDPGRAFGTGSHPTTSLLLKLMEEQDFSNKICNRYRYRFWNTYDSRKIFRSW